ncbi:hypothetical protein D9M70_499970 [compost metagenome]
MRQHVVHGRSLQFGQVARDVAGVAEGGAVEESQDRPGAGSETHLAGVDARAVAAHLQHLIAQQVVAQQHAPQLLLDHLRGLAAQCVVAGQQALLHLPVAQFDFPALAVQVDDLIGREAQGIGHRGQDLAHLALDRLAQ